MRKSIEIEAEENKIYKKMGNIIKVVDNLRDVGLNEVFSLPRIVVLGSQSAGKSSVLESIIGINCLPRGDGVVTRRPLELRLIHIPNSNKIDPYAEFDEIKDTKFSDFDVVREKIVELTDKVAGVQKNIVSNPIKLKIYSNSCPDLTLIDLPGITRIPLKGSGQGLNIEEITKNMAMSYCKDEATIILAVVPANQDIAVSDGLQMAISLDPEGNRTLGVLTKIDIMDIGTNAKKTLMGDEVPLKYGYVGVKNRNNKEIKENMTVSDALMREKEFFNNHPIYRTMSRSFFGTDTLIDKLKNLFYIHLKQFLPGIYENLKLKKQECESALEDLGSLPFPNNSLIGLNSMILKFSSKIETIFAGKFGEKSELNLIPVFRQKFNDFLSDYKKNKYEPSKYIDTEEIIGIIEKSEGLDLQGFHKEDVILFSLEPHVAKLKNEMKILLDEVHDQSFMIIGTLIKQTLGRYPRLVEKVDELMNEFVENHFNDTKYVAEGIFDMNTSHLYIDEKILNYSQLISKTINISSEYYQNVASYIKVVVDYYFNLCVRNLREFIPKTIGQHFFRVIKEKVKNYLLQETVHHMSENLMEENPENKAKRDMYTGLLNILNASEKLMLGDEEIRRIVKPNKSGLNSINEAFDRTKKREEEMLKKKLEKREEEANTGNSQTINTGNIHSNNSQRSSIHSVQSHNELLHKTHNDKTEHTTSLRETITKDATRRTTNFLDEESKSSLNHSTVSNISASSQKAPVITSSSNLSNQSNINNMFKVTGNGSVKSSSQTSNMFAAPMTSQQNYNNPVTNKPIMHNVNDNVSVNVSNVLSGKNDVGVVNMRLTKDGKEVSLTKDDLNKAKNFYDDNKELLPSKEDMISGGKHALKAGQKTADILSSKKELDLNTASEIYNATKEHLPTGQQVWNGMKNVGKIVQKSGVIDKVLGDDFEFLERPKQTSSSSNVNPLSGGYSSNQGVTQSKPKPKEKSGGIFDPLSNLLGVGSQPSVASDKKSENPSSATQKNKKGIF